MKQLLFLVAFHMQFCFFCMQHRYPLLCKFRLFCAIFSVAHQVMLLRNFALTPTPSVRLPAGVQRDKRELFPALSVGILLDLVKVKMLPCKEPGAVFTVTEQYAPCAVSVALMD